MTLLALGVFKRRIGFHSVFRAIIFILGKMDNDVLDAMNRFSVEKVDHILGRGKMAVHTIGNKSMGVIEVGRGFPGVYGKADFMAGSAEFGCGSADHGKVGNTEQRKCDQNAEANQDQAFKIFFHKISFSDVNLENIILNGSLRGDLFSYHRF